MHRIPAEILNTARAAELDALQESIQGGALIPLLAEDPQFLDSSLSEKAAEAAGLVVKSPGSARALCDGIFRLALLRDKRYALLRDGALRRHGLQGLFREYYAGAHATQHVQSS